MNLENLKSLMWHSNNESLNLVIERDAKVGFYLYIFKNHECIKDLLLDSLECAIEYAWENYGVPMDSWILSNNTICSSTKMRVYD